MEKSYHGAELLKYASVYKIIIINLLPTYLFVVCEWSGIILTYTITRVYFF